MVGMDKCNIKGLALGLGAMWGFYVMCAGWMAAFGWWSAFVNALGTAYIGYGPSFCGGIIGGIWGFFDGAVAGIIIGVVYNWVVSNEKKRR